MKYYVIEISTGDDRIEGKGIYEYDNEKSAVATFHSKLGTAMKCTLPNFCLSLTKTARLSSAKSTLHDSKGNTHNSISCVVDYCL